MASTKQISRDEYIETIVNEVAAREGVSPTDLPQHVYTIDPDALDVPLSSSSCDTLTVTFSYCGYDVTIDSRGHVTVDEDG